MINVLKITLFIIMKVMESTPEGAARLDALTAAAHEARAIGARHHVLLSWCREHWTRMALPALFAEIFDIPKTDEEESPDMTVAVNAPTN